MLRDVAFKYGSEGVAAGASRRFKEAEERFELALQTYEQIRTRMATTTGALREEESCLHQLAYVYVEWGRHGAAEECLQRALRLGGQIRTQLGDTTEALRDEICTRVHLGDVVLRRGRLADAQAHYEGMLRLAKAIRSKEGDTPMALEDEFLGHERLGNLALGLGRREAAGVHYETALRLAEAIRNQEGDTPKSRWRVCLGLYHLADIDLYCDRSTEAESRLERALGLAERSFERSGGTARELSYLSCIQRRLGDAILNGGWPDSALRHYEAALQLDRDARALQGDTPETLRDETISLERIARLLRKVGRIGEARELLLQILSVKRSIQDLRCDSPWASRDVSVILGLLCAIANQENEYALAARYALECGLYAVEAATHGVEVPLMDFSISSHALCELTRAAAVSIPWPLYERMLPFVNSYAEFQEAEPLERARPHLREFHDAWLGMALRRAPERVAGVLGAGQGRKVTALALSELHRQAQATQAESVPEFENYLSARNRVIQLELALGADGTRSAFGGFPGMGGKEGGQDVESAEATRARIAALRGEHQAALEAHAAARAALIAVRPALADIAPAPAERYSLQSLQGLLGQPHRALLLLVLAPRDDGQAAEAGAHALLIRSQGAPTLLALPGLEQLPPRLHAWRGHQAGDARAGVGLRDCQGWLRAGADQAEADAGEPVDVTQSLRELLWSVLQRGGRGDADLLDGLSELHVVSHGALHGLPLTLGAPERVAISQYPGLVNFWLVHERARAGVIEPESLEHLQMQIYSPQAGDTVCEALDPIPYVQAEAELVSSCWARRDTPLHSAAQSQPATLLHLACHGTLRQGQEDPCLILSPKDSVSLLELLSGAPSAPIVYLSACLVGQTREDGEGDPLGLVTGFFVRGARCVIAALNPISDFHAPLLAYLFHRGLQAQAQYQGRLRPVAALADAKRQLQQGCWVPEHVAACDRQRWESRSVGAVRRAYAAQMQRLLQDALATGDAPRDDRAWAQRPVQAPDSWWEPLQRKIAQWHLDRLFGDADEVDNLVAELIRTLQQQREPDPGAPPRPDAAGLLLARHLVGQRALLHDRLLPLQHLLMDMQAFGALGAGYP